MVFALYLRDPNSLEVFATFNISPYKQNHQSRKMSISKPLNVGAPIRSLSKFLVSIVSKQWEFFVLVGENQLILQNKDLCTRYC